MIKFKKEKKEFFLHVDQSGFDKDIAQTCRDDDVISARRANFLQAKWRLVSNFRVKIGDKCREQFLSYF